MTTKTTPAKAPSDALLLEIATKHFHSIETLETHLGLPDPDTDPATAAAPWHHALAITYAPQYLGDNADGIAVDWPRIPLPDTRPIFDTSVALGAQVAALLDTEVAVPGVTSGTIEDHLRVMGGISSTDRMAVVGDKAVPAQRMAIFTNDAASDGVTITASADARFLLIAGKPLKEPIVQYGPFVMNSQQEIYQALSDFRDGVLGEPSAA